MLLLPFAVAALAYGPQDPPEGPDKVHLLSAQSAQLIEKDGENFRKVVGPAKFLHNDTYLLCDTALWNVTTNIIDAVGHVRIIQDQTQLSSESLQYVVDDNMAKFRGSLVQLEDKDKNILRTRYLDYNTKDSVAIFQNGGAMRDKDGQIIESLFGTYDSKAHLFVFNDQVNMFMDTTFIKTSRLEYRSDLSTAYFGFGTDMWQEDKMLSANDGWYDRTQELFFFRRKVHLLTRDKEIWGDTLYYHREVNDVEMLGHVELMDTTRNLFGLAGRFEYTDSLSRTRMTREPAVMTITEEDERRDTVYLGADELLLRTYRRCDIPQEWETAAAGRLKDISGDPVMEYRRKAAEEAAQKKAEAEKKEQENRRGGAPLPGKKEEAPKSQPPKPQTPQPADTTLAAPTDTVPPPPDTSDVNFLWGSKRVRMFRRNMQMAADSLIYTDLDSLVRLFKDPIFFSEGTRQYASDSIYMVIKDRQMQRAHLMSNAFITIEEAPGCYDQIRGTEVIAYFDSTNTLTRFDALGGASTLFYLEENNTLATVNKVETKMIYATFVDGEMEKIHYYDNPKNDGYPVVQLPEEEKTLKGFRWEPERRPVSPLDVTTLTPRPSERLRYLARPHATFVQTEDYFPGYINKIHRDIAIRDSLEVVREQERREWEALRKELKAQEDSLKMLADTLKAPLDSLKVPSDSLKVPVDSLKVPADSLKAGADSLSTASPADTTQVRPLTAEELRKAEKQQQKALREKERAEKEARKAKERAAKDAERQARWEELDRKDAEKRAIKEQKRLEKERKRKLKALRKLEKKAQRERAAFEKILQRELQKEQRRKNKTKD